MVLLLVVLMLVVFRSGRLFLGIGAADRVRVRGLVDDASLLLRLLVGSWTGTS